MLSAPATLFSRIKFVIIVDSSNTSLRDNETRQMFRLISKLRKNILIQFLQEAPLGFHQRSGQPILCARPADYLKVSFCKVSATLDGIAVGLV